MLATPTCTTTEGCTTTTLASFLASDWKNNRAAVQPTFLHRYTLVSIVLNSLNRRKSVFRTTPSGWISNAFVRLKSQDFYFSDICPNQSSKKQKKNVFQDIGTVQEWEIKM
jgi:hypothetical protein